MRLLALCGSLRQQSRSRVLLQAVALCLPPGILLSIHGELGALPLFNPDLESAPPESAVRLWAAVDQADAIVIASPEYAHGVTGTIKNALDWLVGHPPFAGKPVAVLNPSHRAVHADEALREVLRTMAANLVDGACLRIPVTACELDAVALAQAGPYRDLIDQALGAVCREVAAGAARPIEHELVAPSGLLQPQPMRVEENL
jgi:chromate reductase, NAD(P)H dehydrogenase (quinone)